MSDVFICSTCGCGDCVCIPSPPECKPVPAPAVRHVFLFFNRAEPMARATIDVPGLGEVQIDSAISKETHDRVIAESVAALRVKLGQVLTS